MKPRKERDSLAERVAARYKREKTAMAVILRGVASHNWGWFSREDPRMHLQTVDESNRMGRNRIKVWLENRGKRIFELADGKLSGSELKRLRTKVEEERPNIEAQWIDVMIANDWLHADLRGSRVTITAYPGHNSFTREIELRDEFPGAYETERSWENEPPRLTLDDEHAALAVGRAVNTDHRHHIDLVKWIFQD